MNEAALYLTFTDPEQAKRLITDKLGPYCREQWAQGVESISVSAEPQEETTELRWFREYWGYVLKPISEQAQLDGIGAEAKGWHKYYKRMFLGYVVDKVKLPGAKRWSISRTLKSTRKLAPAVRRRYIEQVRAHAATTFGVEFPVPPWAIDTAPPSKASAVEHIDSDGVITEVAA